MSIRAMTQVWEHYPRGGSEMLVALALADFCNDAGESLHPSIHTIAEKCRLSDWQARRIVHQMLDSGLLEVIGNQFGGAPGMSRQYRFRLDLLTTGAHATPGADASPTPSADATPSAHARAGIHARDGWHPCTSTPSTGASLTIIEPSITTIDTSKASPRKSVKAKKTELPENFAVSNSVREWAGKNNFGLLDEHLEAFCLSVKAGGYTYADWDAAFKNAIRKDWAGLRKSQGNRRQPTDARFAN
jgi:hypothetical protein